MGGVITQEMGSKNIFQRRFLFRRWPRGRMCVCVLLDGVGRHGTLPDCQGGQELPASPQQYAMESPQEEVTDLVLQDKYRKIKRREKGSECSYSLKLLIEIGVD